MLSITDVGDSKSDFGVDGYYTFKTNVRVNTELGYLAYFKSTKTDVDDKENEEEDDIQEYAEPLDEKKLRASLEKIEELKIDKIKRAKPKYYTPATLITAMQSCGKNLSDAKFRKILSEVKGIGTPATQASFPKELIKGEYIIEKSGHYESTPKGRGLIDLLPQSLKTPEMTAEWELKLRLIESGELDGVTYGRDMKSFIEDFIEEAKLADGKMDLRSANIKKLDIPCPKCGKGLVDYPKSYTCEAKKDEYR